MLGFEDQHTTIVKEPFASEIREKLIRYTNRNFTEEELLQIKKQEEISQKYTCIWK